jgi:cytochrome c oxidase subunit II
MMSEMGLTGLASLPLARAGSFWFPPQASSVAAGHDFVYNVVLWLCVLFFVAICGVSIYFVIKYRKRPGHKEEKTITHHTNLEIAWSVIPLALLMLIFGVSTYWYLEMVTPPEDAKELRVEARKWSWSFYYEGEAEFEGGRMDSPVMHVIVDQPYRLIITTPQTDVIHSLFIPAFRVKQDCVPGRYNYLWFQPTKTGVFDLFCAEYCGTGHSNMVTTVVVHENRESWVQGIIDDADWTIEEDPVERGRRLYEAQCAICHTTDGRSLTGPTFKGLWGSERRFTDGTSRIADEAYIRESIIEPGAEIVEGYPNQMVPFTWGEDTDLAIDSIIAFIRSLDE